MPNIEIKTRYVDLEKAKMIAERVATKHIGIDHQIDTYFSVKNGRLKLRESSLSGAMLIPYMRANTAGPKKSDYALLRSDNPAETKRLLTAILGVEVVVEKQRNIFLAENVRIHIDDVKGLGTFIEFEAVYDNPADESAEYEKVRQLINEFEIAGQDLIQGSYREAVNLSSTC